MQGDKEVAGTWPKFHAPATELSREKSASVMKLTAAQKERELVGWLEKQITDPDLDDQTRSAYKKQLASLREKQAERIIEAAFTEDFMKWLQGQSQYNVPFFVDQKKRADGPGTISVKRSCTPWGNKNLFHVPGVSDFLDSGIYNRADVIEELTKLKMRTPQTIDEAFVFYKYIARAMGVDGDTIHETEQLSHYMCPPPSGYVDGPEDGDTVPVIHLRDKEDGPNVNETPIAGEVLVPWLCRGDNAKYYAKYTEENKKAATERVRLDIAEGRPSSNVDLNLVTPKDYIKERLKKLRKDLSEASTDTERDDMQAIVQEEMRILGYYDDPKTIADELEKDDPKTPAVSFVRKHARAHSGGFAFTGVADIVPEFDVDLTNSRIAALFSNVVNAGLPNILDISDDTTVTVTSSEPEDVTTVTDPSSSEEKKEEPEVIVPDVDAQSSVDDVLDAAITDTSNDGNIRLDGSLDDIPEMPLVVDLQATVRAIEISEVLNELYTSPENAEKAIGNAMAAIIANNGSIIDVVALSKIHEKWFGSLNMASFSVETSTAIRKYFDDNMQAMDDALEISDVYEAGNTSMNDVLSSITPLREAFHHRHETEEDNGIKSQIATAKIVSAMRNQKGDRSTNLGRLKRGVDKIIGYAKGEDTIDGSVETMLELAENFMFNNLVADIAENYKKEGKLASEFNFKLSTLGIPEESLIGNIKRYINPVPDVQKTLTELMDDPDTAGKINTTEWLKAAAVSRVYAERTKNPGDDQFINAYSLLSGGKGVAKLRMANTYATEAELDLPKISGNKEDTQFVSGGNKRMSMQSELDRAATQKSKKKK